MYFLQVLSNLGAKGLVISKKFDSGIGLGLWLFSSASACCSHKATPQERPYKELLQPWQR